MTHHPSLRSMPIVALFALSAASSCSHSVRPDETSAEGHRQEAAKVSEQASATANAPAAPPPNLSQNPGGDPQGYYSPVNPGTGTAEQNARAQRLAAHARQHLNAAAALEASEDAECQGTPRRERAACPLLGPAATIENIPQGVRVRFTPVAPVDRILTNMRCHLAFARARGFADVAGCPLYVRGVQIAPGPDASTIDIVSKDPKVATEIRARALEEVVVVGR
jgi:hypothetical protein